MKLAFSQTVCLSRLHAQRANEVAFWFFWSERCWDRSLQLHLNQNSCILPRATRSRSFILCSGRVRQRRTNHGEAEHPISADDGDDVEQCKDDDDQQGTDEDADKENTVDEEEQDEEREGAR